jgi:hypothetical protein
VTVFFVPSVDEKGAFVHKKAGDALNDVVLAVPRNYVAVLSHMHGF